MAARWSFKLSNRRWTRRVVSNAPYRATSCSQYVRRDVAANCQAFRVRTAGWKNRLGLKYGRPCSKGSRHRDLHAMMRHEDLPRRESRDAVPGTWHALPKRLGTRYRLFPLFFFLPLSFFLFSCTLFERNRGISEPIFILTILCFNLQPFYPEDALGVSGARQAPFCLELVETTMRGIRF